MLVAYDYEDDEPMTYEMLRIYKRVMSFIKIIKVLLEIIHYQSCPNLKCDGGNVCIPVKMKNLNVIEYKDYFEFIYDCLKP